MTAGAWLAVSIAVTAAGALAAALRSRGRELDRIARMTHRGKRSYLIPIGDGDYLTYDGYSQRQAAEQLRQLGPIWPAEPTDPPNSVNS